jgi:2-hydroxychromene-2-carboxylate isomerase
VNIGTFYFDLGSPYAYLAASRLERVLGGPVDWQPVLLGGLFKLAGRSSWARGDDRRRQAGVAEVERRAASYGLPPIVWPDPWPADYLFAMRVATYALTQGRVKEFATGAFADAFQRGRRLDIPADVLSAAEQAGLDPAMAEVATGDPEIKRALHEATDAAYVRDVVGVPTTAIGQQLFWGDDRLEEAAQARAAA